MRTKRDRVLIIKSINYSEKDKILTVFGENLGKYSLFAKGIRGLNSKNRGNMQTMSLSNISYYEGKGLRTLLESEGEHIPDYKGKDMKNIERILFLLNKFLPEEEPEKKIFKSLVHILKKDIPDELVSKFRVQFLTYAGLFADSNICLYCESEKDLAYIDMNSFAVVCKNCYSNKKNLMNLNSDVYSKKEFISSLDRYIEKTYSELV
jgi:DNA repair protein RecO (recombination protein O)